MFFKIWFLSACQFRFRSRHGTSYFVPSDKVCKALFSSGGPKKITLSVIFLFLLSSLRAMFSQISSLRKTYTKPRRSPLLSPSRVNRLPRFAVPILYHLSTRQSMVAVRCFSLVQMGWSVTDENGSLRNEGVVIHNLGTSLSLCGGSCSALCISNS